MIDNSAKAKLLFSYFLSNFDRIFNNKNPRWILNKIYSTTAFEEEYPNAGDIIGAAGFKFGKPNIHHILKDENNNILAALQYDAYNAKVRYYINSAYTRQFIDDVRATKITRPGLNSRAWFVFTYSKYKDNILIEQDSSDNSIQSIHIMNRICSMDDSYFYDLLRNNTHEKFSFGFSFDHRPTYSELTTILEVLLNITRNNNLL